MNKSKSSIEPLLDPVVIGNNIRALRRRAHLNQGALATAIGIRQGPLCNLEKGKNLPSSPVLWKIATILRVSTDTILRQGAPDELPRRGLLTSPASLAALPPPRENAFLSGISGVKPTTRIPRIQHSQPLIRRISTLTQDYMALEDLCRVPRQAQLPLNLPFDTDPAGIARLTWQVRHLMGIRGAVVFDYPELLENHGLRVVFTSLEQKTHSLSFFDERYGNAFLFVEQEINPEKQIFALARELGNIYIHTRGTLASPRYALTPARAYKVARLFAANFLMPEESVIATVRQIGLEPDEWDFPMLLRIKHRFGVSAEAFNYRLLELRLITPERQQAFRETIQAHYAQNDFAEPGQSRRILSPNGRLGDLLHTALRRGDEEAGEIAARLRDLKLPMP